MQEGFIACLAQIKRFWLNQLPLRQYHVNLCLWSVAKTPVIEGCLRGLVNVSQTMSSLPFLVPVEFFCKDSQVRAAMNHGEKHITCRICTYPFTGCRLVMWTTVSEAVYSVHRVNGQPMSHIPCKSNKSPSSSYHQLK
jgi:hypothetical protein